MSASRASASSTKSECALEWYVTIGFGLPSPIQLGLGLASINYTSYPQLFTNGVAGIDMRVDVPYSEITASGPGSYVLSDSFNRPLVPYFFCSDEFVGNLTCQRLDSGADAFEQATDIISRYKNFYLLNNFKRDRYTFRTSLAYRDRVASRYLALARAARPCSVAHLGPDEGRGGGCESRYRTRIAMSRERALPL